MSTRAPSPYACRFCAHAKDEHNGIVGCTHCRCLATPGEAMPVTEREGDRVPLAPGQYLADYRPAPEPAEPVEADLTRYDEAVAQMTDPDRYAALRALTFEERHPCPVKDCRLSAEEHHRLAFGAQAELRELRRRVRDLEHGVREREQADG